MSVTERIEQLGGVQALAAGIDVSGNPSEYDQHRERVVGVAAELVCRFAPDAPTVVLQEAIFRCASWLLFANKGSIASSSSGPRTTEYAVGQTGALRHSPGPCRCSSPWKVRRAGAV